MKKTLLFLAIVTFGLMACSNIHDSKPNLVTKNDAITNSSDIIGKNDIYKLSKDNMPCDDAQNQRDLENCLQAEFDKSEEGLHKLIKKVISELQKNRQEKDKINFEDTQKMWNSYRTKNCKSEKDLYEEGSEALAVSISCQLKMTNERIKEIHRIYDSK